MASKLEKEAAQASDEPLVEEVERHQPDESDRIDAPGRAPGGEPLDVSPGGDGSLVKEVLKEGMAGGPQALTTPSPLCEITLRVRADHESKQTPVVWPRQHHGAISPPGLPAQLRVGIETMRLHEVARLTHVDHSRTPAATRTYDVEVVDWDEALVLDTVTKRIVRRPGVEAWREPRELDRVVVRGVLGGVDYGPIAEDRDPSLAAAPLSGGWRLDEDVETDTGLRVVEGLEACVRTMRVGEVCEVSIGEQKGQIELAQIREDPNQALIAHRGAWAKSGDAARRSAAVDALRALGNAHLQKGDLGKALKRYDRALAVASDGGNDDGDTHLLEDSEDAQAASKAAHNAGRELVKRRARAVLANRALAHLKAGDALGAKRDCEAVLEEDPDHLKCRFRRAQALVDLGSVEDACAVFVELARVPALQRDALRALRAARATLKAHRDAERELYRGVIRPKPAPQGPRPEKPRREALERTVVASLGLQRAAGRAASDSY